MIRRTPVSAGRAADAAIAGKATKAGGRTGRTAKAAAGEAAPAASGAAGEVKVTFVLDETAPEGPVSVVGDFNGWTPGTHVLRRRSNGTRSVSVTLPKGAQVRFRYLGANGHWFDDPEADGYDGDAGVLRL